MEKLKEIKINKDIYVVSFQSLGSLVPLKTNLDKKEVAWVCAYVILKGNKPDCYMDLENCTYNNDDVFGVDTNHSHNWNMTFEEKFKDAEEQIKDLIKSFRKFQSKSSVK